MYNLNQRGEKPRVFRKGGNIMLYATWIVASVLLFPIGLLVFAVTVITGWQLLPLPLLNLLVFLMVASVPGVAYFIVVQDL